MAIFHMNSYWLILNGQKQPPEVFYIKKSALKSFAKFTGKHLCQILFWPEACNFNKKEALAQVFSGEFFEVFKNTFFTYTFGQHALYSTAFHCFTHESFITNIFILIHFFPMLPFYTPCKYQKIKGFLMFSGGIKRLHWEEMG